MKTLAEIRKENRDREYADALRRIFDDKMIAVPRVIRETGRKYKIVQLNNGLVYELEDEK